MAALIGTSALAAETAGARVGGLYNLYDEASLKLFDQPYPRPKNLVYEFDLPVLLISFFIFLIILGWFESLRLWLEFAFNQQRTSLLISASELTIYSIILTVFLVLAVYLIIKYWIK